MDKKYYDAVISEMMVLLEGQHFVKHGDLFANESKAIKVWYKEEGKLFVLSMADIQQDDQEGTKFSEENIEDFVDVSSWLFEEGQTERDSMAVGVDFADTLREKLGIKTNNSRSATNIALPTVEKGDDVTIISLTQKLLANFPQHKETYKENVAKYGKLLYLDFLTTYFVPEIKSLLGGGSANKKQAKKLFDMLAEVYVEGNSETTDAVVALIAASIYDDEAATETVNGLLKEEKHLSSSLQEFLIQLKKSKSLQKALLKNI